MRRFLIGALLLAGLAGLLYLPTGSFDFLRFDDHDYTFRCAFVFDGLSWANLKEAFANVRHAGVWMPVTYISYMVDISLFGPGPGPHHLVNVALHALNAVLLLALARRLRGKDGASRGWWIWPAVAFWALHPQRVEAVAWIAARKELLWSGFTLAGLLCWLRRNSVAAWLGACAFCALACMSKPTAMCFPLLAFGLDQMVDDDVRRPQPPWQRFLPYLPLAVMALATGALAAYSQTHAEGHAVRTLFGASFPWRLLNAAVAIGLYLFQMAVPVGIHLDYRAVPGQFPLQGTPGLAVLGLGLLVSGFWLWSGKAGARNTKLTAILWFLAALLPTLGVLGSFGEHARADRFLYVPAMAVTIVAARSGSRRPGRIAHLAAGAILVLLASASWPVIASYRNDATVFARTLAFDPDHGRALAHVGQATCAKPGGIDRGIDLLRRSQAVRPRDDTAAQLAYALAMRGHSEDFAEIRRLCGKFACDHRLDAKGQALEALGMTAMRQRRWDEAIGCLEDSIRAPRRFYSAEDAQLRLAAAYCNAGRGTDAVRMLEPLAQSQRTDIRGRARLALDTLRRNPRAVLLWE